MGKQSRLRPAARGRPRGFTLVEVCAAVAILTVVVTAMVASQTASMRLARETRTSRLASDDLAAAMEEVLALPLDDIPLVHPEGVPIAKWSDLHLEEQAIVPTYPNLGGGGVVPDPLEVRLTLTWTEPGGRQRSRSLASLRTK